VVAGLDQAVVDDRLVVADVVDEPVEGREALGEARFDGAPLGGVDDRPGA